MTPTGIVLIRTSWAAVEPIADTAAGLFYDRCSSERLTPDVRAAWTEAYGTLATVMIEAARADTETAVEAAA